MEPRATGSDLRHGSLCLRTFRDRDQPRPEGRAFLLLGFLSWILRPGRGSYLKTSATERTCQGDPIGGAARHRIGISGTVLSVCGRFGIEISLVLKGELSLLGFLSWILRPGRGSLSRNVRKQRERQGDPIGGAARHRIGLRHGSLCLRTFRDRDQPRPEGRAFLLLGFLSWDFAFQGRGFS